MLAYHFIARDSVNTVKSLYNRDEYVHVCTRCRYQGTRSNMQYVLDLIIIYNFRTQIIETILALRYR